MNDFDNISEKIIDELNDKKEMVLKAWGKIAEEKVKDFTPVDTGRLRNSMTYVINANKGYVDIGSNVEYAPVIEFRAVGKNHMIRNGIQEAIPECEQIAKDVLKRSIVIKL